MEKKYYIVIGILVLVIGVVCGAVFLFSKQDVVVNPIQEACEVTGGSFVLETAVCTCSRILPLFVTSTQGCTDEFGNTTETREAFATLKKRTTFSQTCELQEAEPYTVVDVSLAFCSPLSWGGAKSEVIGGLTQVTFPRLGQDLALVVTGDPTALFRTIGFETKKQMIAKKRLTTKSLASYLDVSVDRVHEISTISEFDSVFVVRMTGTGSLFFIPYAQSGSHVFVVGVTDQMRPVAQSLVSSLWFDTSSF